jgi:hypothetical protein
MAVKIDRSFGALQAAVAGDLGFVAIDGYLPLAEQIRGSVKELYVPIAPA